MGRIILSICFLLGGGIVLGQSVPDGRYTQVIPNTSLSFSMEAIPAGTFLMGSKTGNAAEKPVHRVKVSPFWMSTYEITWDVFEAFLYQDYELSKRTDNETKQKIDAVTRPTKPYLDMTFGMGDRKSTRLNSSH